MDTTFPGNVYSDKYDLEKAYNEVHDFLNEGQPFLLQTDIVTPSSNHYIHKHKEIEIIFGLSGSGYVTTEMKSVRMNVGDIVVINPNAVHFIASDSVFKYYFLIIDTGFLLENGIDVEEAAYEEYVTEQQLSRLITSLTSEYNSDDEYRSIMLRSLVLQIVVNITRYHLASNTSVNKEGKTLAKIKHSISYIKNNFRSDLSLEDIAEKAGLSKYHFCREFKKATELTPIEYINRTRCEYARNMLESRKYSVSEIGELCGFSTSAHFSRTFKRFFGTYPSDYIKKIKNS